MVVSPIGMLIFMPSSSNALPQSGGNQPPSPKTPAVVFPASLVVVPMDAPTAPAPGAATAVSTPGPASPLTGPATAGAATASAAAALRAQPPTPATPSMTPSTTPSAALTNGQAPNVMLGMGIPRRSWQAYSAAAAAERAADPGCQLDWRILAGIGEVGSDNAVQNGAGLPGWDGLASPAIVGPPLDGRSGRALMPDTDGGRYDGDPAYDHRVGPLQLLPRDVAAFGHGGDPQNIDQASLTAARLLCAEHADLGTAAGLVSRLTAYNPAIAWVAEVLATSMNYVGGTPAVQQALQSLPQLVPAGGQTVADSPAGIGSGPGALPAGGSSNAAGTSGPGDWWPGFATAPGEGQ